MTFPTITSVGLFSKEFFEFASTSAFPTTGVQGRLYVATNTNNIYRWDGNQYVLAGGSTETEDAGFTANYVGQLVNGTYTVVLKAPYAGRITETTTACSSGTGTFTFYINSVALNGTPNAVSSTEQSQVHTASNAFAVGDTITFILSDASTLINPSISVIYIKG